MEATKKKKAYLKPEMNRFEMKMEAPFLAGSKDEIIITPTQPDKDWTTGILEPHCTKDGVAKKLGIYEYTCFRANSADLTSCELFALLGANIGEWIKVTRIDDRQFRAEIVNEQCSGGVTPDEEMY